MSRARAGRLPSAVVDTVILVRAILSKRGNPYRLTLYWRASRFQMITSPDLKAELSSTLAKPRITRKYAVAHEDLAALIWLLENKATPVKPFRRLPVPIRDPKDVHVLGAVLAGKADYLVTDDDHLLDLKDNPKLGKLRIIRVGEFLDALDTEDPGQ